MTSRVLVLGGSGMLGSMVVRELGSRPGLEITATARTGELAERCAGLGGGAGWRVFDALEDDLDTASKLVAGFDWVINCIGVIKPLIRDGDAAEVERAVRVNALFPHLLARATAGGARVLQIATDCVYSGTRGGYREDDAHDPLDVYGKSKSLGEVRSPHVHHLRCSIVGPEVGPPRSLLEWFLGQPAGGAVNGFVNHRWNGVTTLHFARVCAAIVARDPVLPHVQHLVPRGAVSKHEILEQFALRYGRDDVTIRPTEAALAVDRTLDTADEALNRALWASAGFAEPPSVPQMLAELARSDPRGKASAP